MQNKRVYEKISIALFFIGAFLIINEQVNITGAVIGFSGQPGFSAILGFSFIISSLILLSGVKKREYLEEQLKNHDYNRDENYQSLIKQRSEKSIKFFSPSKDIFPDKQKKLIQEPSQLRTLNKLLHLRSNELAELFEGKEIEKTEMHPKYTMDVSYKIKGDKLYAIIGVVGGTYLNKQGKATAFPGYGMKRMNEFRDNAIKAGRKLNLKEVIVGGMAIVNKPLKKVMKERYGFQDEVIESKICHPDGKSEPINCIVKHYKIDYKK